MAHVVIGLKTTKGTKQLKLDPSIYESIQKEKVSVGDVIYIEANSGAVKRVSIPAEPQMVSLSPCILDSRERHFFLTHRV